MIEKILSITKRTRSTPFTSRVEAAGVKSYAVYNHMLLPAVFESIEADYWHLCEHVQVWDVACERQVEIKGPDSQRLVQLMTPRDISRAQELQCLYVPLCDIDGGIVNDPIAIKHTKQHWWLSIADSDVGLWAKGLATGYGMDVTVDEPDVWPLAVQGPKAEQLMARVFGDEIKSIRFFRGKLLYFKDQEMLVVRSGWSKQGGFEIYLNNADLAEPLWDELFRRGQDLNVRAGCPNKIERIESGLLSFGGDITAENNPFECGLDAYINIDADIESLSHAELAAMRGHHKNQLIGLMFDQKMTLTETKISFLNQVIGNITSEVWSPKYKKHLAFAMVQRDHLRHHSSIDIDGISGRICELPFDFEN
jgi:dimethylsulfoniopropionate demethylase